MQPLPGTPPFPGLPDVAESVVMKPLLAWIPLCIAFAPLIYEAIVVLRAEKQKFEGR